MKFWICLQTNEWINKGITKCLINDAFPWNNQHNCFYLKMLTSNHTPIYNTKRNNLQSILLLGMPFRIPTPPPPYPSPLAHISERTAHLTEEELLRHADDVLITAERYCRALLHGRTARRYCRAVLHWTEAIYWRTAAQDGARSFSQSRGAVTVWLSPAHRRLSCRVRYTHRVSAAAQGRIQRGRTGAG